MIISILWTRAPSGCDLDNLRVQTDWCHVGKVIEHRKFVKLKAQKRSRKWWPAIDFTKITPGWDIEIWPGSTRFVSCGRVIKTWKCEEQKTPQKTKQKSCSFTSVWDNHNFKFFPFSFPYDRRSYRSNIATSHDSPDSSDEAQTPQYNYDEVEDLSDLKSQS